METTVSNIFLHNLFELQLKPSHPWSKDYVFAGIELSSCIWHPHTRLMTEWGEMAKNLLCSVLCVFLSCFLCCHWASVSVYFLTCPAHFWGSESSSVWGRHRRAARWAPRRWLLSLWLSYQALGTISGEKKVLMDKCSVGQVQRPAWRVPMGSGVECLCRTGRSKGSSCCASCGVSVELWNTGMCSVGEQKCNKTYFPQKSPFFQTLSGELPKWICKWLPASK